MYKSSFGLNGQIQFNDEHEYYFFLGFLAKSDGSSSLTWEHNENQGAWGSEGRIHFYTDILPPIKKLKLTAGTSGILHRVNCNEFVRNLSENHGFVYGRNQNVSSISRTIPAAFLQDFINGFNM